MNLRYVIVYMMLVFRRSLVSEGVITIVWRFRTFECNWRFLLSQQYTIQLRRSVE